MSTEVKIENEFSGDAKKRVRTKTKPPEDVKKRVRSTKPEMPPSDGMKRRRKELFLFVNPDFPSFYDSDRITTCWVVDESKESALEQLRKLCDKYDRSVSDDAIDDFAEIPLNGPTIGCSDQI